MRRALLISPSAKAGGAERAFLGLARNLPPAGWEPTLVLLEDGPLREWLEAAGLEPLLLRAERTRHLHRTALTVARLTRLARSSDVVVSCWVKGQLYGGTAAALARVPAVWWHHGIATRSRVELLAGRAPAAVVVCVSDAAAAAQRTRTPRRRIETVHPGIPIADVAAASGTGAGVRARLGWEHATVIGILGRLQRSKGHEDVLRAFAALAATRPELRLAVVGGAILGWEGSYADDLRALAHELGIADRVHFAGHQPRPWAWLDSFDVAVHASTGDSFGLVLVEAMALGKPVIATADGGPAEIVEHGRSGLLVPPARPAELAAAIVAILDDGALAARLADGGRRRAQRFTDVRSAAAFARVLDTLARPQRAGVPLEGKA